jgi:hypothetical protein
MEIELDILGDLFLQDIVRAEELEGVKTCGSACHATS